MKLVIALLSVALCLPCVAGEAPRAKTVVLIAGRGSHGYGTHAHRAGCLLLAQGIRKGMPGFQAVVCERGWPKDESVLDQADAIVILCDGSGGHLMIPHLDRLDALMKKGVGLACLHYATTVPNGKPGDRLREWLGGCYETHWSVNPVWMASFVTLPKHPITRGVRPFTIRDE